MSLTLAAVMALSHRCAPGIALEALVPQVLVESHFSELAIGINNGPIVRARSVPDAIDISTRYIRAGYSVDLGLAQINSHNLRRLGLTVEQAFDPCTSLRAAEVVLTENYNAVSDGRTQTDAIEATWSLYNSGSPSRGMRNGYVRKVWTAAATLVPQMQAMLNGDQALVFAAADAPAPAPMVAPSGSSTVPAPRPRWIYGTPDTGVIVFK